MTKEEVRFQVALSCIQGVLEAKHGVLGEIIPAIAVSESLRIADEFVRQWFHESEVEKIKDEWKPTEEELKILADLIPTLVEQGRIKSASTLADLHDKMQNLLPIKFGNLG